MNESRDHADAGPGTDGPNAPGRRSGEGANSIWDHLERDQQRKTTIVPGKTPAPGKDDPPEGELPEPQRGPAE